jgi:hypothetical protein
MECEWKKNLNAWLLKVCKDGLNNDLHILKSKWCGSGGGKLVKDFTAELTRLEFSLRKRKRTT